MTPFDVRRARRVLCYCDNCEAQRRPPSVGRFFAQLGAAVLGLCAIYLVIVIVLAILG